eukprot:scaffold192019_cov27-Tisochrysis_lutea.AAC.3
MHSFSAISASTALTNLSPCSTSAGSTLRSRHCLRGTISGLSCMRDESGRFSFTSVMQSCSASCACSRSRAALALSRRGAAAPIDSAASSAASSASGSERALIWDSRASSASVIFIAHSFE